MHVTIETSHRADTTSKIEMLRLSQPSIIVTVSEDPENDPNSSLLFCYAAKFINQLRMTQSIANGSFIPSQTVYLNLNSFWISKVRDHIKKILTSGHSIRNELLKKLHKVLSYSHSKTRMASKRASDIWELRNGKLVKQTSENQNYEVRVDRKCILVDKYPQKSETSLEFVSAGETLYNVKVLEKITQGGMANVYKVQHEDKELVMRVVTENAKLVADATERFIGYDNKHLAKIERMFYYKSTIKGEAAKVYIFMVRTRSLH
jgi:hypothetical protein